MGQTFNVDNGEMCGRGKDEEEYAQADTHTHTHTHTRSRYPSSSSPSHRVVPSPSAKLLAVPCDSGSVKIFDIATGTRYGRTLKRRAGGHRRAACDVTWITEDRLVSASFDHTLMAWHLLPRQGGGGAGGGGGVRRQREVSEPLQDDAGTQVAGTAHGHNHNHNHGNHGRASTPGSGGGSSSNVVAGHDGGGAFGEETARGDRVALASGLRGRGDSSDHHHHRTAATTTATTTTTI